MHIIKITQKSFKVILSEDDLDRYGGRDMFENPSLCKSFLPI